MTMLLLAILIILVIGTMGEILLVGKRNQHRRSLSWDGVLSPEDFEEVPHVFCIEYGRGGYPPPEGSLQKELTRIGVCPQRCTCLQGLNKDSLHAEEVAPEMSVSITDGQGLVVTAWSRLEPRGSQPQHGSKLNSLYGDDENAGGAETKTVTAQVARMLSHAAALRMVQDAQLAWAVVLEDTSPGLDHKHGPQELLTAAPPAEWGRSNGTLAREVVGRLAQQGVAWNTLLLSHSGLQWPGMALDLLTQYQQGHRVVPVDPCGPMASQLWPAHHPAAYAISHAGALHVLSTHLTRLLSPPSPPAAAVLLPFRAHVTYVGHFDLRPSTTSLALCALLLDTQAFVPTGPTLLLLTSGPPPSYTSSLAATYRSAPPPPPHPSAPLPPLPPLGKLTLILLGGAMAQLPGPATLHPGAMQEVVSRLCVSHGNHSGLASPCQLALRTALSTLHRTCLAPRHAQASHTLQPRPALLLRHHDQLLVLDYPVGVNVSQHWQQRLGCDAYPQAPPICTHDGLWAYMHGLAAVDELDGLYSQVPQPLPQPAQHPFPYPYPLAAFWHICTMGSWWSRIVEDQARRLGASGLLPHLSLSGGLHATVVGDVAVGLQLFKRGLSGTGAGGGGGPIFGEGVRVPGLTLSDGGADWGVYEFPTLMQLEAYCEAWPAARVLYVHSKGASVPLRHMPSFLPVSEWRRYMEHFTVMRFNDCLEAMDEEQGEGQAYNTCGVELINDQDGQPHFYAGNFWGDSWRPASCYESKMDMYYERLPLEEYEHHVGCRGMRYTKQAPDAMGNDTQAARGPYTRIMEAGQDNVLPAAVHVESCV